MATHLKVRLLARFKERLFGVMGRRDAFNPVWIPNCKAVHTFGIRQKLHLLWLNKNHELVRLDKGIGFGRIKFCSAAVGVVELPEGYQLEPWPVGHKFKLRGQALVEAALVMPLLFLLLFGFIELGLILHSQQQLTYVTQYSTQVGSLTNHDLKITGAVEEFYDASEVSVAVQNTQSTTNLPIVAADRRYNDLLQVQLSQPYRLSFLSAKILTLRAEASARVLCQNVNPPYQCD